MYLVLARILLQAKRSIANSVPLYMKMFIFYLVVLKVNL